LKSEKHLVLGTRGSDLALAQTQIVIEKLHAAHTRLSNERKVIKTTGDNRLDLSFSGSLEQGLFTKELEEALLAGSHSCRRPQLRDLPTDRPDDLVFGAILKRADPSDVLRFKTIRRTGGLPIEACVATSSPRPESANPPCAGSACIVEMR
jgi:hydroxymethylbilane synthase